jgi:hypothetical protein
MTPVKTKSRRFINDGHTALSFPQVDALTHISKLTATLERACNWTNERLLAAYCWQPGLPAVTANFPTAWVQISSSSLSEGCDLVRSRNYQWLALTLRYPVVTLTTLSLSWFSRVTHDIT